MAALENEVTTEGRALGSIEQRVLKAYEDVTGTAETSIRDVAALKDDVTAALAAIPLLAPLWGSVSVIDLDFEAAERAIDQEEGGAARKTLDSLNTVVTSLSALQATKADADELDELIALAGCTRRCRS